MIIAIVGNEAAKFDKQREEITRTIIRGILGKANRLVSGGCHLGGVDIWAEEEADKLSIPKTIYKPKELSWDKGYKPRNLLIAQNSDSLHNIVVASYPENYSGMKFPFCYHCNTDEHVKSGGCWTLKVARYLGKKTYLTVIK